METSLFGVVALDAQMWIFLNSHPMLQVNCPILHDVGPTPSPCYPWIHLIDHTPSPMQYHYGSAKDDIDIDMWELFLVESAPIG
jgi:hypothetical protein